MGIVSEFISNCGKNTGVIMIIISGLLLLIGISTLAVANGQDNKKDVQKNNRTWGGLMISLSIIILICGILFIALKDKMIKFVGTSTKTT